MFLNRLIFRKVIGGKVDCFKRRVRRGTALLNKSSAVAEMSDHLAKK